MGVGISQSQATCASGPPSKAEPQGALLEEFRAWGDLTAPAMLYSVAHMRLTFATSTGPQVALEGFRGACRWTTHPLTKTQHPQPRLYREKLSPCLHCGQNFTPNARRYPGLPSNGRPGDRPGSQPGGANSGTQKVS